MSASYCPGGVLPTNRNDRKGRGRSKSPATGRRGGKGRGRSSSADASTQGRGGGGLVGGAVPGTFEAKAEPGLGPEKVSPL